MSQKCLAVGRESDTGIAAEQRTVRHHLVFVQNLQSAVQTVEVDYTGGLIGNRLVQRFLGVIHNVADFQDVDLCSLRQAAVQGNAAVLDLVKGAHKNLISGYNAQRIAHKIVLDFILPNAQHFRIHLAAGTVVELIKGAVA